MAFPNIFPTLGSDVVGIFNDNFTQLFPDARPLHARVRPNKMMMRHPLETGQPITDYSIVLPIEIELPMIVTSEFYRDVYQQISAVFKNSELLTVQTKATNYQNMALAEMPHEEDPDRFDALTILLRFVQVQTVLPSTTGTTANPDYAPADPTQAPTQNSGQQQGNTIAGIATPNGLETLPINPANSPLAPETQVISIQTQNGTQLIPLYPHDNPLTQSGSINGLTNNFSVSGIQTINGPQALGIQGGL